MQELSQDVIYYWHVVYLQPIKKDESRGKEMHARTMMDTEAGEAL